MHCLDYNFIDHCNCATNYCKYVRMDNFNYRLLVNHVLNSTFQCLFHIYSHCLIDAFFLICHTLELINNATNINLNKYGYFDDIIGLFRLLGSENATVTKKTEFQREEKCIICGTSAKSVITINENHTHVICFAPFFLVWFHRRSPELQN